MTIYQAATKLEEFLALLPAGTSSSGMELTTSPYDPLFSDSCVANNANTRYMLPVVDDLWIHFQFGVATVGAGVFLAIMGANGVEVIRFNRATTNRQATTFQYRNASNTLVNVSTSPTELTPINVLHQFDLRIKYNTDGTHDLEWYINKLLQGSVSGVTLYINSLPLLAFGGVNWVGVSEYITSDTPTLDMRYYSKALVNAGSSNTFAAGTVADIDEVILDVNDMIRSTAVGQKAFFRKVAADFTGYEVLGVQVSGTARKSHSGPGGFEIGIRTPSGTETFAPAVQLSYGWHGFGYLWETNPVTGVQWTRADAESALLEAGVRSAA